jgi:hypothetical protein
MPADERTIRASVDKLLVRALADPDFAARAREDPRAALLEAGVPEEALTGERLAPEEMFPQSDTVRDDDGDGCVDFTCWSSECGGTCAVSLPCCAFTVPLGLGSAMVTLECLQ